MQVRSKQGQKRYKPQEQAAVGTSQASNIEHPAAPTCAASYAPLKMPSIAPHISEH
jgi:hypothetical protein